MSPNAAHYRKGTAFDHRFDCGASSCNNNVDVGFYETQPEYSRCTAPADTVIVRKNRCRDVVFKCRRRLESWC